MEEQSLLDKLIYIAKKGVEIKWEKKMPIYGVIGDHSISFYSVEVPDEITEWTLFTNVSLEEVENSVKGCLSKIKAYEDYMKKLEDNAEVTSLIEKFNEALMQ